MMTHCNLYTGQVNKGLMNWKVLVRPDGSMGEPQLPLDPRHGLCNHSPDGFSWGYNGSGPAQLAFALVYDATGDLNFTRHVYQQFKSLIVANLDQDKDWYMSAQIVRAIAKDIGREYLINRHQSAITYS
jgi:hypothetical protein